MMLFDRVVSLFVCLLLLSVIFYYVMANTAVRKNIKKVRGKTKDF